MYNTSLRMFVTGFKQKESWKDIQLLWQMLIMIIFWMKLCVVKKMSLKGMWVLIVTRNSTNDNNHNAIFYVVFHYIIIKYLYVNVIWLSIIFFMCLVSIGPKEKIPYKDILSVWQMLIIIIFRMKFISVKNWVWNECEWQ